MPQYITVTSTLDAMTKEQNMDFTVRAVDELRARRHSGREPNVLGTHFSNDIRAYVCVF